MYNSYPIGTFLSEPIEIFLSEYEKNTKKNTKKNTEGDVGEHGQALAKTSSTTYM